MPDARKTVLFVAPVPPPVHGAAYAMQFLLTGRVADEFRLLHVDSRFTDDVATLQEFSLRKVARLLRYCWQITKHSLFGGARGVVLTPTCYFKPFLKDAVFIWLCRLLGRRITAWIQMDFRAMKYESLSRCARWFVRTTLRRCHRFVLPADRLRQFLPDWIPAERVDAIPNGLPERPLPDFIRPEHPLRVLYLSNIEDNKGWRTFLEAAREIGHRRDDVEFILHGSPAFGLTDADVAGEIAKDNLAGRLRWLGPAWDEDKWNAFAAAHVFCFPSWHEAFPLSVLEAMCAGLPIVATEVGGVPDAVARGEGGLIVPPRDAAALRDALTRLLDEPQTRAAMSRFNRTRWRERYTVTAYRDGWCRFLHSWLGSTPPAPAAV
jgi:glycosyltransferase involved in cell wall biosynthesis